MERADGALLKADELNIHGSGEASVAWPDGDAFIGSFSSGHPYSSGRFIHNGQNNFVDDIAVELQKLGKL